MARRPAKQSRRARNTKLSAFDTFRIEGALLQPELVERIVNLEAADQAEADYGLDPKEKLRDVAATKFALAQSLHARFVSSDMGPQAARRFLVNFFTQAFEFTDLAETSPKVIDGRSFPVTHQALSGRVPFVFAPPGRLDEAMPVFGDGGRRRSAPQLMQEFLNADDDCLWGIACDGVTLRLYRDNAALTRPAYIEADLYRMFDADAPRLADFAALWLILHVSRFGQPSTPPSSCALERWREEGLKQGATAREKLREGVEAALKELGLGLMEHPANVRLLADLREGRLAPQAFLQALLRLIYRFIFILTAEDRDVLHSLPPDDDIEHHAWRAGKEAYANGYSLGRLRDRAVKRAYRDRHSDAWAGVVILIRELWRGQKLLALPALGGLFARSDVREFDDCHISNARLFEALFRLAWIRVDAGLQRVNWRDMETEELGSVYESLLELTPRLFGASLFDFVTAAGNERKTTASYYTPDSLVQALLDETLNPLIEETVKEKTPDAAVDALLALRIIDPACGSGHFLLAAARRLAGRVAAIRSPGAPSPADYRHWMREVARHCLFGVDRNPMAVELAKVALWIETVEPNKPLSFLDAHIRCGDSLFGVYDLAALQKGVPDEAYAPLIGDDKMAARAWRDRNRAEREARKQGQLGFFEPPRELLEAARAIESQEEDELTAVEAKATAYRTLMTAADRYRLETACDLYIAAYVLPKTEPPGRHVGERESYVPTTGEVWRIAEGSQPQSLLLGSAIDAAKAVRAFHWPLEFPQIFYPGTGHRSGFDLAIGNPPWERIKLAEQEFFAVRAPDIAVAPTTAARQQMIATLETSPREADRRLFAEFGIAKRTAGASSVFARTPADAGGRFPLTGVGDVNTYALFSELFATIAPSAGLIVPTGVATDATTAPFFVHLMKANRVAALISFYEIRGWFGATDDRKSFCILCLNAGQARGRFIFSVQRMDELSIPERWYRANADELAQVNPNTGTVAIFRSGADADLTRSIYARTPVLVNRTRHASSDPPTNPWGVEFVTMFHMSNDSDLFRTALQLDSTGFARDGGVWRNQNDERYVPLLEAKMIHHFDHRWATYVGTNTEDATPIDKADPEFEVTPRYWVPEPKVTSTLSAKGWTRGWLMGWRDIALASVERTVIGGAFPACGVGNSLPLWLCAPTIPPSVAACLVATLSSLTLDFVSRHKVGGTHLNFFIAEQLPILPPSAFSGSDLAFIVPRVLELSYTSHLMRPFANDLGFTGPPFGWDEERRALLRAEIDARIARLYGLTRDTLRYILDPEDVMGKGYPSETFRVLKKNDIANHGEYRTARLVLAAWDREEAE